MFNPGLISTVRHLTQLSAPENPTNTPECLDTYTSLNLSLTPSFTWLRPRFSISKAYRMVYDCVLSSIASIVFCLSCRGHAPKLIGDNRKTVTGFTGGKNRYVTLSSRPTHRPLHINYLVLYIYHQKQDSLRQLPGQAACTGATAPVISQTAVLPSSKLSI